jgi:hypothetical protein
VTTLTTCFFNGGLTITVSFALWDPEELVAVKEKIYTPGESMFLTTVFNAAGETGVTVRGPEKKFHTDVYGPVEATCAKMVALSVGSVMLCRHDTCTKQPDWALQEREKDRASSKIADRIKNIICFIRLISRCKYFR